MSTSDGRGSEPPEGAAVLLVDDQDTMHEFVLAALGERYRVLTASDGEAGWRVAQGTALDLVLTDLRMPKLDGHGLLRRLRESERLRDVPVIVFTGAPSYALRLQLLQEGAQDFLAKPFSIQELSLRVDTFVTLKRTRDALRRRIKDQDRNVASLAEELADRQHQLEQALTVAARAREEAERASAYKSQLLGLVSHELRTPLASMRLQVDRLSEHSRLYGDEKQARLAQSIDSSVQRLQDVVEVLLSQAQLEAQRLSVLARPMSLPEVVSEVVDELEPRAARKGLGLILNAAALPALCSDPRLVRLVVRNLVGNAIRYTEKGRVVVTVEGKGARQSLVVEDTGPGIRPAHRERVFRPYERLATDPDQGEGLGLALVQQLVRALAGRVELGGARGGGACFTVTLPNLPAGAQSTHTQGLVVPP